MATREQIWSALFALIQTQATVSGGPFVTVERKLRHWNDVGDGEQPYIAQIQEDEEHERKRGLPRKMTLHGKFYVYGKAVDRNSSPGAVLNPLMDAIEAALAPDDPDRETCTLGGLVYSCWISGKVETDEGLLGDQAVAIVPITIMVP